MTIRWWGCCTLLCLATSPIAMLAQQPANSKSRTIPGVAAPPEPAPNNPVKGPGTMDQKFMKNAAIGDAAEIQLGQMAQAKATDPQVKSFGERMVKDHSKADDQLQSIAQEQHVGLPTELDAEHKAAKSRLSEKTGSEFDKDYIRLMVQEHQRTIDKFKREAESSNDPTIKQFAQSSLPMLQSHLQEAQQIESSLMK
jgi:putative membrane protein